MLRFMRLFANRAAETGFFVSRAMHAVIGGVNSGFTGRGVAAAWNIGRVIKNYTRNFFPSSGADRLFLQKNINLSIQESIEGILAKIKLTNTIEEMALIRGFRETLELAQLESAFALWSRSRLKNHAKLNFGHDSHDADNDFFNFGDDADNFSLAFSFLSKFDQYLEQELEKELEKEKFSIAEMKEKFSKFCESYYDVQIKIKPGMTLLLAEVDTDKPRQELKNNRDKGEREKNQALRNTILAPALEDMPEKAAEQFCGEFAAAVLKSSEDRDETQMTREMAEGILGVEKTNILKEGARCIRESQDAEFAESQKELNTVIQDATVEPLGKGESSAVKEKNQALRNTILAPALEDMPEKAAEQFCAELAAAVLESSEDSHENQTAGSSALEILEQDAEFAESQKESSTVIQDATVELRGIDRELMRVD